MSLQLQRLVLVPELPRLALDPEEDVLRRRQGVELDLDLGPVRVGDRERLIVALALGLACCEGEVEVERRRAARSGFLWRRRRRRVDELASPL